MNFENLHLLADKKIGAKQMNRRSKRSKQTHRRHSREGGRPRYRYSRQSKKSGRTYSRHSREGGRFRHKHKPSTGTVEVAKEADKPIADTAEKAEDPDTGRRSKRTQA